ncbi:hypothetical protein [Pacificibacter sp. AS14]|uniref:hypothetical protein n=1 Tax=Pacificibacter sp. AS14 TaxID=3135785 RepID=UPI00317FEBBD
MSVSKIWGLAIGLFCICVLASTLQLSAAMPKSAKATQAQIESDAIFQHATAQSQMGKIPNVTVACAMPIAATHQIAQCTIGASAK